MPASYNPNLEILETAVKLLGPLADDVVFLGGCTTGLLVTDSAAPLFRVTLDVDFIVEVASLVEYYRFTDKLRQLGLTEDSRPGAPICRWRTELLVLDVMPTDPAVLGFGNRWFAKAFRAANWATLPSGKRIRLLPAPYFLATKIEAFNYRGKGDFHLSYDIEDLVAVLDGRAEVVIEVRKAEPDLRCYIGDYFLELLQDINFLDALPGYLPPDTASQDRLLLIIERMKAIAEVVRCV